MNFGGSTVRNFLSVLLFPILIILSFFWEQSGLFVRTANAANDQRGLVVRPKSPTGEELKGEQWILTIGIDSYLYGMHCH